MFRKFSRNWLTKISGTTVQNMLSFLLFSDISENSGKTRYFRPFWPQKQVNFDHFFILFIPINTKSHLSRPLSVLERFWAYFRIIWPWSHVVSSISVIRDVRHIYASGHVAFRRRPSIFENSGMCLTFSTYSENSGIFSNRGFELRLFSDRGFELEFRENFR